MSVVRIQETPVKAPKHSDFSAQPSDISNNSEVTAESYEDTEDEEAVEKPSTQCCSKILNKLQTIDAGDLHLNRVDPGVWDECGAFTTAVVDLGGVHGLVRKFRKFRKLRKLLYLMMDNGGVAFLIVLVMTYIAFGYPTYLLETLMGQYSGCKPIQMIRQLMPLFSGLGVALHIRTLVRCVNVIGHFVYSVCHCWDLLFCKGFESVILKRTLMGEKTGKTFKLFTGITYPYRTNDINLSFAQESVIGAVGCIAGLLLFLIKLKDFSEALKVVLRLLPLFLAGYTISGCNRAYSDRKELAPDSMIYLPFYLTFHPDWSKIIDGRVWVKAIIFVAHSLELGTLVHPYLGSKMFFHYRCTRDGAYLIILTTVWNLIGVIGILIWLGYVGIDAQEIKNSFQELEGHYGMFIVFIMKNLQAELTQQVETDVLFFCSVFYLIVATTSFLAAVCYLYILIDCSYPESGHPTLKLGIMFGYFALFSSVVMPLLTTQNGLRHLIFINFYVSNSWVGILLIIFYVSGLALNHGMARLLHDFYNIIHLKGYEVRTHFYQIPKLIPFLFIGFLVFSVMNDAVERSHPTEGATDWTDPWTVFFGYAFASSPIFAVIFGIIYFLAKEKKEYGFKSIFEPHRDLYKNKHHVRVCFKDYEHFDPERKYPEKKESSVKI